MKKKIVAVLLSTVLVLGTLTTGCRSTKTTVEETTKTETSEEGTTKTDTTVENTTEADSKNTDVSEESGYQTTYGDKIFDDVTITVEIFDRSLAPTGSTMSANKWVDYVNENMNKVGINVEYVAVPRTEEISKLQTMLATDTACDIVMTYDTALALDYYKLGGTVDLSPYVDGENQAKNLKAYVTEDTLDFARDDAGALYAITSKRATTALMNTWIREDWLKELGLEVPNTVDELFDVLVAFKENYPDCVPYVTNLVQPNYNTLAYSFLDSVLDQNLFNANFWNPVVKDEGAKDYFAFINKMYNAGLMDPEYYVSDSSLSASTRITELILADKVGVVHKDVNTLIGSTSGNLIEMLREDNPDANYIPIEPLENINDGNRYQGEYNPYGMFLFIPKTTDNDKVEACITYLDWLCTEAGGVVDCGFEGEHYNMVDGARVIIDSDYNYTDKDYFAWYAYIVGNDGYYPTEELFIKSSAYQYGKEWEDDVLECYDKSYSGTLRRIGSYDSPKKVEYSTAIGVVNDEYTVKCITCPESEFEATYAAYQQALKDVGADEVAQEYYDYFGIN